MVALEGWVAVSAIGVDDDGVCGFEDFVIADPVVVVDFDVEAFDVGEAFLEEEAAGVEFVEAGAVAWFAGDEDEFFVGGFLSGEREGA